MSSSAPLYNQALAQNTFPMHHDHHYHHCQAILESPIEWAVHILEFLIAFVSLTGNVALIVILLNAVPLPISLRRSMVAGAVNFALLSGYQLTRNTCILLTVFDPCLATTSTISCKVQQFPLVFCYIYGALAALVTPLLMNNRQLLTCASCCSIWQMLFALLSAAFALLFTAFDDDRWIVHLPECSILLALRQPMLGFILLTLLMLLQSIGLIIAAAVAECSGTGKYQLPSARSLRDVAGIETAMWLAAFIVSGGLSVWYYVLLDPCQKCIISGLEISFSLFPLCIAFAHPWLVLWQTRTVREAAVRLFPGVSSLFPEHDFVLLPPPSHLPPSDRFTLPAAVVMERIDEDKATEDELDSLNTV